MPSPDATPPDTDRAVARHRRRALLLLAAAAWNLWLWTTRIYNLATDEVPRSAGFVTVHLLLYAVSLAFTAAFAVVGVRMWREARRRQGGPGDPVTTGPDGARSPARSSRR